MKKQNKYIIFISLEILIIPNREICIDNNRKKIIVNNALTILKQHLKKPFYIINENDEKKLNEYYKGSEIFFN